MTLAPLASPPTAQLIDAPSGKLEVDALWQGDDPNNPAIEHVALLCHPNPLAQGTMMNKVVTTMYRFARDHHMHVVRFNYRGVGQSTGSYGEMSGEIEDALTVLHWIGQTSTARKLWLGGFSFGGYVAARVAGMVEAQQDPRVQGFKLTDVALIAPSIEKHDTQVLQLPHEKTFLIYGSNDELIAPAALQAFGDEFGLRSHVIADTGHFFHGKLTQVTAALQQFTSVC